LSEYQITWVTSQLGVGHAPLSYADLDAVRKEGVDAIVNLCGEYCDLHEIEKDSGFKVYYLPIHDECAPDMKEMEDAITWVGNRIRRGRKVLVHCRFGVGRTGTFVTAYLLKEGFDMKTASRRLKHTRANPTNSCQWKLLRKYQKKLKGG
jgi:protein-tyrosine phosphatase